MVKIPVYTNSILATLMSILGYLLMLGGFAVAFGGEILGGILMFLLGMGSAALGSVISALAQFRKWIRKLKKEGIIERAKEDTNLAIQIFQANPTKLTFRYIRKLNPAAGDYLEQQLAIKKQ